MHQRFDRPATVTRADWRLRVAILLALSAFHCGGTPSDTDSSGSAGTSHAGASAGGTSGASTGGSGGSSGGASSGGMVPASGTSGAGGSSAGAAGNAGAAGSGGGQACGDQTCGANEYCRAPCNGAGLGGSQSLGNPTCAALPTGCNGVPSCECICGIVTLFCTPVHSRCSVGAVEADARAHRVRDRMNVVGFRQVTWLSPPSAADTFGRKRSLVT